MVKTLEKERVAPKKTIYFDILFNLFQNFLLSLPCGMSEDNGTEQKTALVRLRNKDSARLRRAASDADARLSVNATWIGAWKPAPNCLTLVSDP